MSDKLVLRVEVDAKTGVATIKNLRDELKRTGSGLDEVSGKAKGTGGVFSSMWAQMALGQAVFAAIGIGFRKVVGLMDGMINTSIDAQETFSKFHTVFQDASQGASDALVELTGNYGMAEAAAAAMLADTGDLLTGLGMTGAAALDLSLQTQKLGADLASFTNYSGGAEGASQALTKAMLGEREMLKSLGIAISEEMVMAELASKGQSKLEGTALMAAKAQATLNLAMKQSPNAMGDAIRTMDSGANVARRWASVWQDFQRWVGDAIMETLLPLMQDALKWVQANKEEIQDYARKAGEAIGDIVRWLKDSVLWLIKWKDELLVVAGVMASVWAVNKISAWASAAKAALATVATLARSSAAGMGAMGKAGLMGVALGAGWAAGTWIRDTFAVFRTEAKYTMAEIDGMNKAVYEQATASGKRFLDIKNELQGLEGASGKFLRTIAVEIDRNSEAYAGLSTAAREYVEQFKQQSEFATQAQKDTEARAEAEKLAAAAAQASAERQAKWEADHAEAIKKQRSEIDALLKKYNDIPQTLSDQLREHQKIAASLGIQNKELNQIIKYIDVYADGIRNMPKSNPFGDFSGVTVPGMFEVNIPEYKDAPAMKEDWKDVSYILGGVSDTMRDMGIKSNNLNTGIGMLGNVLKTKVGEDGVTAATKLNGAIAAGAQIAEGLMETLGVDMESGWGQAASGIMDGLTTAAAGGFNPVSIALGAVQALGGIAGALFGGNGVDDMVDDFERLGVSINSEIVQKIKDMKDAGIDAGVAQAQLTDEIIRTGEVTAENMDGYKRMVQDIFMQLDNGRMSAAEATREVGDAFVALAAKAKEAGLEGGKALADLLNDARNRGLVGSDMMAYVDAERAKGLQALSAHINGTVTSQNTYNQALWQTEAMFKSMKADGKTFFEIIDAMGPALDTLSAIGKEKGYKDEGGLLAQLFGFREFAEENQGLLANLQATQTYMESMANTGVLTADQFAGFQTNLRQYQDQLKAAGASETEQMQALFPMLAKQAWYAKEYGFTLDENTQRLVDQAREQGYNIEAAIPFEERQIALMEMQNDLTASLIEAMGGKLPEAFRRSTEAAAAFGAQMSAAVDQSRRLSESIGATSLDNYRGDATPGGIQGFAAGTNGWITRPSEFIGNEDGAELFQFRGDKMKVTPAPRVGRAQGVQGGSQTVVKETRVNTMKVELYFPNVTNVEPVNAIMTAIERNDGNIRGKFKRFIK